VSSSGSSGAVVDALAAGDMAFYFKKKKEA
jgi:hypothetical protein